MITATKNTDKKEITRAMYNLLKNCVLDIFFLLLSRVTKCFYAYIKLSKKIHLKNNKQHIFISKRTPISYLIPLLGILYL